MERLRGLPQYVYCYQGFHTNFCRKFGDWCSPCLMVGSKAGSARLVEPCLRFMSKNVSRPRTSCELLRSIKLATKVLGPLCIHMASVQSLPKSGLSRRALWTDRLQGSGTSGLLADTCPQSTQKEAFKAFRKHTHQLVDCIVPPTTEAKAFAKCTIASVSPPATD